MPPYPGDMWVSFFAWSHLFTAPEGKQGKAALCQSLCLSLMKATHFASSSASSGFWVVFFCSAISSINRELSSFQTYQMFGFPTYCLHNDKDPLRRHACSFISSYHDWKTATCTGGEIWVLMLICFPYLSFQWCSISACSPPWWSVHEDCRCHTLWHNLSPQCSGSQVESSLPQYWWPEDGRVRSSELQEHGFLLKENGGFRGFLLNKGNYVKNRKLIRSNAALVLCACIKMGVLQRKALLYKREQRAL